MANKYQKGVVVALCVALVRGPSPDSLSRSGDQRPTLDRLFCGRGWREARRPLYDRSMQGDAGIFSSEVCQRHLPVREGSATR